MVSVVVKFEIAFGREQNFESSLSRVAAAMLATSFCTKCDWYKSVQSKGVYMLGKRVAPQCVGMGREEYCC